MASSVTNCSPMAVQVGFRHLYSPSPWKYLRTTGAWLPKSKALGSEVEATKNKWVKIQTSELTGNWVCLSTKSRAIVDWSLHAYTGVTQNSNTLAVAQTYCNRTREVHIALSPAHWWTVAISSAQRWNAVSSFSRHSSSDKSPEVRVEDGNN